MKSFWKGHFLTLILVAADVIAFSVIWREAWQLRHALNEQFGEPINAYVNYRRMLPRLLVLWIGLMAYFEHYSHRGKISSLNQIGNIIKAGMMFFVATPALAFMFKQYDIGRSVIVFAVTAMTIYVYASRSALRWLKEYFVRRGHGLTRVAIIGAGKTGREVAARIKRHPEIGYNLVGFIDRDPSKKGTTIDDVPVIGVTNGLVDLLLRHRVEEVFLAVPSMPTNDKFNLITECEQAKVHFKVVTANLFQVITNQVKIDDIGGFPVILLADGHLTPAGALIKRMLDLAIAIPFTLIALPFMAMISLIIRLESPGPSLFVHDRVGKDGKIFKMYKFRTMRSDVNPYEKAPSDSSDPRITRFGKFLRKTSLDELPQLLNVLKGDMSMVGPRPEMPFIVAEYEPWQRRRLDVPQGITGLWQVAGRKHLPLHLNLEYDFYYIRNWSPVLDLVILVKTVPAVLLGKGAF